jgi:hypothetical protein
VSETQTQPNTSVSTHRQDQTRKLSFTQPHIRPLGNIVATTGQGGSSDQYDSYDGKRP